MSVGILCSFRCLQKRPILAPGGKKWYQTLFLANFPASPKENFNFRFFPLLPGKKGKILCSKFWESNFKQFPWDIFIIDWVMLDLPGLHGNGHSLFSLAESSGKAKNATERWVKLVSCSFRQICWKFR